MTVRRLAPTTLPRDQGLLGTALTGGGSGVIVGAPRKGNAMARQLLTMLVPGRTVTKRARGCGHRRHVVPAAVVAAACMVALMPSAAAARQPYLRGPFGPATVHRVVRDLGRVGIGVYRPGSARPVARVRGRRSPVRLTSEQARTLAFGAWARSGATGSAISARTGRVRISRHRRVASAIMLAGWAKRARTPSARLARRLLGTVRWRRYRQVVFPSVVQLLFASDMALHLRPHARRHAHGATAVAAAGGPCSAIEGFVTDQIDAFFASIGRIETDRATIDRLFGSGLLGDVVKGVADILSIGANAAVDAAHRIVIGGVKVATSAIASTIAGVASVVAAVNQIANAILPWAGRIQGAPNPVSKGVGSGVPGILTLTVTAPGSTLQWPAGIADCAGVLGITLPSLVPQGANVSWDVHNQDPAPLLVAGSSQGRLDEHGTSTLPFTTATETPAEATGDPAIGAVVAVATVHRRDLDQLLDRITDDVFNLIPPLLRNLVAPRLRALLRPLIDSAKARIGTVQDIQVAGVEAVRYHTPREGGSGGGSGGRRTGAFHVVIRWPGAPSAVPPLLDVHTCVGLRGPWSGTLNMGPTTAQLTPTPVRFTTPTALFGMATGARTDSGVEGEVDKLTLHWNIPVEVSAKPSPAMSFPGARRRLITVISTPDVPDQQIDTGWVPFTFLATQSFPIREGSTACR